ncbi:M48 family metallopeptidase [Pseudoalteromonas apostichopi]|uniref:M48 family metallopeptidase n=1 Tax=Pseudoalteromonas apostichopi TaxID=3035452 RepID=UPI002572D724|nr:SprT family zinc-dependent metalloprotease [Pseudoalteromonas sp. FE4]
MAEIQLGDIPIEIVQKNIKNVHLSVHPPNGRVRVSAPLGMEIDTIRVFVISKLSWVKQQQKKFINQQREAPREFIERESHYFQGKRYQLRVKYVDAKPSVSVNHKYIVLETRRESSPEQRSKILNEWYRLRLKSAIPELIKQYEKIMQVSVAEFGVKKMKTKWGTCNPAAQRIWLNLELAKKPPECLEYIVVHEMTHLIEPTHNKRFTSLMDLFLPKWRLYKDELNKLPVRHENWSY